MKIHKILLGALLCTASLTASAQGQRVTGQIVDEAGEPLIGATIQVLGTKNITVTDVDGKYSLDVPKGSKVQVSYIGYLTKTITVPSKLRIIELAEDNTNLDEVVVTGYGSQKIKNLTGSVEVVNSEDLKDLSVTSLGEAMRGMVNGLHVNMNSSVPGSAAHLTIRQSSDLAKNWGSINAKFSSQDDTPLYVIDDFISSESAFNNLDMSEVESISVLKDAAAAIYGAQGAYGVILVKTKRGKEGKPRISYNAQIGVTDRLFKPKMMNAYEWGRTYDGYMGTATDANDETRMRQYFQADELEAMRHLDYDLLDKEWSAAVTQRHSVNISGGTQRATYFGNLSYNTQDGNLGKLDYDRWNYRAGANVEISKWFKASFEVSGNNSHKKTPRNRYTGNLGNTDSGDYALLFQHLRHVPATINGLPVIYTGMLNTAQTDYGQAMYNYYAIQNSPDYNETNGNSTTVQGNLTYDFGWIKPLKGLTARFSYSRHFSNSYGNSIQTKMNVYRLINRGGSAGHLYAGVDDIDYSMDNFEELTMDNGNRLQESSSHSKGYQMNFSLNYARSFGLHDIAAFFSIEKSESESRSLSATGNNPLPFTDGMSNSTQADASGDYTDAEWGKTESGRLSYIGRLTYDWNDRYLFQFLIRSDASTKFAPKNYWGTFPSFSGGWVISEEPWFPKEKSHIDYLKLRASWGLMGRDNINPYVWMTRYNRDLGYGAVFGSNSLTIGKNAGMIIEQGGANPDAHWDKTYKTNIGLDIRLLKSRLSITADYYMDRGREIFSSHQGEAMYPSTVGVKPVPENFAELNTYGFELNIGWRDHIGKDFNYWVKMQTGYTDNKVKKIAEIANPDRDDLIVGKRKDRGLWGYSCIGMFRSYQEIEEYFNKYKINEYLGMTKDAVRPGMLIYKDVNGKWDAQKRQYDPTPDGVVDENDMVQISKRTDNPYGVTFNFGASWKRLSFSAQLAGSWGSYSLVPTRVRKSGDGLEYYNIPKMWNDMYIYDDVLDAQGNVIVESNHNGSLPNIRYSTAATEPSTFWKISNAMWSLTQFAIAYDLPKPWLRTLGISGVRLNVTCQNAINFKSPHYRDAWSEWGGNYGYYPNLRKWTIGLNVSF